MQRQRLLYCGELPVEPHSPHVVGGDRRHREQIVAARALVRAGDHAPTRAVPVLRQRVRGAGATTARAHGPHVVGGDGRHPPQGTVCRRVGAGDDGPT